MLKNGLVYMALCLCTTAMFSSADPVWSPENDFDGSQIVPTAPMLLLPTDKLAYSTAMLEGTDKEISIMVSSASVPGIDIFYQYGGNNDVEGTYVWNYTSLDIPKGETYSVIEYIDSSEGHRALPRVVTLVPEPAFMLLLGLTGTLLLRRRAKLLPAVLTAVFLMPFAAQAATTVSNVSFIQLWPFSRDVVIHYSVATDSTEDLTVKFYGTTDNGATMFDLSESGTLAKDGAGGTISGSGARAAVWTPDSTFYSTKAKIKIGVDVTEPPAPPKYMVLDLSSNETEYLDETPSGGWTDEYKTTKMVLRYVPAGVFSMGSPSGELGRFSNETQHSVTLSKPFYIGVFEVTQKQFELIYGSNPSSYQTDMYGVSGSRPVEGVSYEMIRGANQGAGWPGSSAVDSDSFLGKLRARTDRAFDLPTEAQWEYACRAETTTALNSGKNLTDEYNCDNVAEVGRYSYNTSDRKGGYWINEHTVVGLYSPNAWGLYDMHGNVSELCLDWEANYTSDPATDPQGPASGSKRVYRGGSFFAEALDCRSACRSSVAASQTSSVMGLRLVLAIE